MYLEKLLEDILEQEPTNTDWPEATFEDGWVEARSACALLVRAAIKAKQSAEMNELEEAAKDMLSDNHMEGCVFVGCPINECPTCAPARATRLRLALGG